MDWEHLLFGEESLSFLGEVAFRTAVMFLITIVALRLSGKRGVSQLSIFEVVMIIALGSAAGDPMFYKEVGILHAVVVFAIVLLIYRIIVFLIGRYEKVEILFEGKPVYVIRKSKLVTDDSTLRNIGIDEFFAELREKNIEHLGQVNNVILETNGVISILFHEDENVVPGLPIWPELYNQKSEKISSDGLYSCAQCGNTRHFKSASNNIECSECRKNDKWVKAIKTKRIV